MPISRAITSTIGESCCPLIGLASDVARGSDAVKAAYREVLEVLVQLLQADLNEPRTRERALALVALCVGGIGRGEEAWTTRLWPMTCAAPRTSMRLRTAGGAPATCG